MSRAEAMLAEQLALQAASGRSRRRRIVEAREPGGVRVTVEGRTCSSFCSNDYLGLADHPRIVAAFCAVTRPPALLFSTGCMANLAVASVLVGRGGHVLEDRLKHASLLDAGLVSGARFSRYAHGDVAALLKKLSRSGVLATAAAS